MSFSDDHDRRLFESLGPEMVETIMLVKHNDPDSTTLALTFDGRDFVSEDHDDIQHEKDVLGRLGDIIGQNTTLKELAVKDCPEGIEVHLLFPGLQNNRTIEKVHFVSVLALEFQTISGLSPFLSLNPKLREVAIDHCELRPSDIEILSTALLDRTADTLESLSLEGNDLSGVALDGLVRALARNRGLTELNLSCTRIGSGACASLAVLLESQESNLTRLDLSFNRCTMNNESWSILLKILCDSSCIDRAIGSNHTLCDLGLDQWDEILGDGLLMEAITRAIGDDDANLLRSLLDINRNEGKALVARHKVLWAHTRRNSPVNIGAVPSIPSGAMPFILAWLGDNSYSSAYGPSIKSTRLDSFYRILRSRPQLLEGGWLKQRVRIKKTMDRMKGLCDETEALRGENTKLRERIGRLEAMMQAACISESPRHV